MTPRTPKSETVATLVEGEAADPPSPVGIGSVGPGKLLGRYVILDVIGEGGMGVVYAAYDPELDRKIAVKLLHRADHRRRLIREAKAMARLAHPNVITVLDVGWFGRQLWMAMEYIDGRTFKRWVADERPSWRRIIEYASYAGIGLAAAHAEGMVHRDFKPDNVMVAQSGRVVVMDFGLVRQDVSFEGSPSGSVDDEDLPDPSHSQGGPLDDDDLTRSGTILGTPAYMAPEQHAARPVDARADQFAFCVSVWEALYGQRPFAGKTSAGLAAAVSSGRITIPADERGVPRRIRAILERGLARDPDQRWASMRELVDALRHDPWRRRRRAAAIGLGVLTLGGAGWWATRDDACRGAASELAQSWGPERRGRVAAALSRVDLPYAAQTEAAVVEELDRWGAVWVDVHRRTCLASAHKEQSASRLDARMACLSRIRGELDATVALLGDADAEVVDHAADLAAGLTDPAECWPIDATAAEHAQPDPAERAEVEAVRARLAEIEALSRAGKYDLAMRAADALTPRVEATTFVPLGLEAGLQRGGLLEKTGRAPQGRTVLDDVLRRCIAEGVWTVCSQTAIELVYVVGYRLSEYDAALVYATTARGLIARGARSDAEPELLVQLASAHMRADRFREALAALDEAIASYEAMARPPAAGLLLARQNRATVLSELQQGPEVERALMEVMEQREARYGDAHPSTASSRINYALFLIRNGRADEAEEQARAALAVRLSRLGPDHPSVADAHTVVGLALYRMGRNEEGEAAFRRAYEILESALGPEHPDTARALGNLTGAAFDAGDYAAAERYTKRAIAALESRPGVEPAGTARWHHNLGVVYRAQGKLEAAEAELRDAIEREKTQPDPPAERGATEHYLGLVLLEQGRASEAVAAFEQARAEKDRVEVTDEAKAETLFGLARARQAAGASRDGVRELAEQARRLLGDARPELTAEIDAFLRGP